MLLLPVALAYEVDAWTPRRWAPADARAVADAHFDTLLDEAIAATTCEGTDDQVRRRLARAIAHTSARRVWLDDRKGLARMGHGVFSGWLESDPAVDRVTTGSDGMFRDVGLLDGFVLHTAGTASTVNLGGVLVGTDKVDHFLATGHSYFVWSDEGEDPERALRRGVNTEKTTLGLWTSKAFSYADLAANWDGYRFYAGLLQADSPIQRGEDGCPERVRGWDWSEWVHPDWDEFANPSVYTRRVARKVAWALAPEREAICAAFAPVEQRLPPAEGAPVPEGPLGLAHFCPEPVAEVRVATVNVWGLPWPLTPRRRTRMATVARWLDDEDFDVVAIQEAWRGTRRHLPTLTWPDTEGDSGLALYTDHPHESLGFHAFDAGAGVDRFKRKGVWWSRLEIDGAAWVVGVLHLQAGQGTKSRTARAAQVDQVIASAPAGRLLLLGDFNLHRGDPVDRAAAERLEQAGFQEVLPARDEGTSIHGSHRFDRVYVRGAPRWDWSTGRTWRAWAPSDHFPVSARLRRERAPGDPQR